MFQNTANIMDFVFDPFDNYRLVVGECSHVTSHVILVVSHVILVLCHMILEVGHVILLVCHNILYVATTNSSLKMWLSWYTQPAMMQGSECGGCQTEEVGRL